MAQTYDQVQHKLNLIDNDEFDIATAKDKSMNFIMVNSGRQYFLNNKDVVGIMDYDLIDRLIRGISIDTERSQKVFHHLIDKKMPVNLRPVEFTRYLPAWTVGTQLYSNKTVWSILNRTVYRSNEIEGADTNFLFWLRQHKSKYLADETEAAAALRKEFGFHKVYPEDLFYKTFKRTQIDLLEDLRES